MKKTRYALCAEVAGTPNAAALLFRIAYWHGRMKIVRDGKLWIVKSRAEWLEETGLSMDQYKRALTRLRRQGLVETRQGLVSNRNVTHLRLTGRAILRLGMKDAGPTGEQICASQGEQICASQVEQICSTQGAQNCPTHIKKHYKKGITEKNTKTGGPPPASDPGKGFLKEGSEESMKKGGYSAKDVVKPKKVLPIGQPDKVSVLEGVWKEVASETTQKFVPPLTGKQKGQLKLFAKACPDGTASAVLETVLRDWTMFVKTVETAAGAKSFPAEPNIDFLLKHVGVAVNMHLAKSKSKTPAKMPAKAATEAAHAPKAAPVTKTTPKELTEAEKAEILDMLSDVV